MNVNLNLNRTLLAEVAAESIAKVNPAQPNGKRWIRAITKAVVMIEENPFIEWQADSKSLLIMSETSGNIYSANGVCGCRAFEQGQPCKHRAAARLVMRCMEKVQ